MDTLGVICARAGSERVPRKAWQEVGPLTLLEATLRAAAASHLSMYVIATDDERSCQITGSPHLRLPEAIANGPLIGTLQYVCDRVNPCPSVIVTLQACIAFRQAEPINRTIEMLERCELDSAQTVVNVGWDHAPIYKPNGAVYATRLDLIRQGRLWGARHGMVLMAPRESINIDTEWDLRVARGVCMSSS